MIKNILKSDDFKLKNCINYLAVIVALVVCMFMKSQNKLPNSYANLLVQIEEEIAELIEKEGETQ